MKNNHIFACSIIIPCFNEEGNVADCIREIPIIGDGTEIIFINDGSSDKTERVIEDLDKKYDHVKAISYENNIGKAHAVRLGCKYARGEILMIYDADRTVPAENLSDFYNIIKKDEIQFVNGSRMLLKQEKNAMKFMNYWGNKCFAILVSLIIKQKITDALCGTKVFYKKDFDNMKIQIDPWGDFDFLFETRRLKLKVAEFSIKYKARQAGKSKMKSYSHALQLLITCIKGSKLLRRLDQ